MNKSPTAASSLITEFFHSPTLALIQEPPLRRGLIYGFPHPLHVLSHQDSPRTAIIHNPSLNIWPVDHLSSGDCQAALWHLNKITILVASIYWPINEPHIPDSLPAILAEASASGWEVIVGMDSNAHHHSWGSPTNNARGSLLANFISDQGLILHNVGDKPTFVKGVHHTHIDLTLSSYNLQLLLHSWDVSDDDHFSDHKLITATLSSNERSHRIVPNYRKTNWDGFKGHLNESSWDTPDTWCPETIEMMTDTITSTIQEALRASTPLVKIPDKPNPNKWWTDELRQLRRQVRVAFHESQRFPSEETSIAYKEVRSQFKKSLKKAKQKAWEDFTSSCDSVQTTAKLT